jgi:predicted N-formylglutamate amidohydrolase
MNDVPDSLLAADEPAPVTVHNENGSSPFLIVADHAGNFMPRALGRLGVLETECERHIAWDIGIAAVCRLVADALDATLIQQIYSRLVIDCNRPPGSETSIPETGEFTPIPGNIGLSESRKATRVREIFRPYHDRIVPHNTTDHTRASTPTELADHLSGNCGSRLVGDSQPAKAVDISASVSHFTLTSTLMSNSSSTFPM